MAPTVYKTEMRFAVAHVQIANVRFLHENEKKKFDQKDLTDIKLIPAYLIERSTIEPNHFTGFGKGT